VSILFPVMANELRFKSFRLLEQRSWAETLRKGRPTLSQDISLKTTLYGHSHKAQEAVADMKSGSAIVDTPSTISTNGFEELIDYSGERCRVGSGGRR
jgi:hypothetical protein